MYWLTFAFFVKNTTNIKKTNNKDQNKPSAKTVCKVNFMCCFKMRDIAIF